MSLCLIHCAHGAASSALVALTEQRLATLKKRITYILQHKDDTHETIFEIASANKSFTAYHNVIHNRYLYLKDLLPSSSVDSCPRQRGRRGSLDNMWDVQTHFQILFLKDLARMIHAPQPNRKWPPALVLTTFNPLPMRMGKGPLISDFRFLLKSAAQKKLTVLTVPQSWLVVIFLMLYLARNIN